MKQYGTWDEKKDLKKGKMKSNRLLIDNFGKVWVELEGEICLGDMAYSHDTGDVYYVDDEEDLYLFNNIASKVEELKLK